MGAPLLHGAINGWIVPTTPPGELVVGSTFSQSDGLTGNPDPSMGKSAGSRTAGNTPFAEQTSTRSALAGVVGTVGGAPLPVRNEAFRTNAYTQLVAPYNLQLRPATNTQANPGLQHTVMMQSIINNPAPLDQMTSIFMAT